MGILTLLRNAFGRSRKGRAAEGEPSRETASEPTVPAPAATAEAEPVAEPTAATEPAKAPEAPETAVAAEAAEAPEEVPPSRRAPAPSVVDELVSAAFDRVTVPKPRATEAEVAEAEVAAPAEPVAAAEPVTEPEPAEPAEPVATTDPDPVTVVEPEPVVAEESTPVAAEAIEPAAADGDQAPQGPPAADDESSTGGAGGNDTAEGEAEAAPEPVAAAAPTPVVEPEPEPVTAEEPTPIAAEAIEPAADDESSTGGAGGNDTAEGEAEAATPAKPAVPITRLKTRAPGLVTAYKAADAALKAQDLTGTRAKVYLVLDRSASMRPYYKDGSAQALGEQALALAAHLDPEATVHVVFFSTELDGTGELTLTEHENKIDELHAALGRMGRTSYHAAVEEVVTHYEKHEKSADPTAPALVIFQTDGAPDAKTPATQSLTDAAKNHPALFFSFIAFGDPESKAFDYVRKLKTDNTSLFLAGETPKELTDTEVYEGLLASWRP